jgi:hypothetical protein
MANTDADTIDREQQLRQLCYDAMFWLPRLDSADADGLSDYFLDLAVACFAAGGIGALADQKTEAAKLLLTQIRK